ncbi:20S proteasome subunit beta 6 [Nematocida minor]|uniref:20S proteasome subunit beta 6 n=1 Tax=Nematocida minor TaxID=1912983 RepID=UPI00221E69AA|nr:20S proteasome subunit beta 6 [Nematocida minor]KAI5190544.1 20S proteasome subunit beta 6 [Nematocida minor]
MFEYKKRLPEGVSKKELDRAGVIKCSNGDDLYADNSGTSLSIVGADFCIVASDTRHSASFSINTRQATKSFCIDGRFILSTTGFYADSRHIFKELAYEIDKYQFKFDKKMGIEQAAAILHILLYNHRFFPKYTYCCLVGFNEKGEPKVFSYDPVGSYQETPCRCNGSGTAMLQPMLDSWITRKNWYCEEGKDHVCSEEEVTALVRDVFNSVAETDVKTGDGLEVYIIKKDGISRSEYPLRSD